MTKRIFKNILFVSMLVLCTSFVLFLGVLYKYFSDQQIKQLEEHLQYTVSAVEESGLTYLEKLPKGETRITLIAANGDVLFDNKADIKLMPNHREREEVQKALANGKASSTRYSKTMTEETTYYAMRLENGSVLRLSVTRLTLLALILSMVQPICLILLFATACAIFFANRLSKKLVEPLTSINYERPLTSDTYDELAPVLRRMEEQRKKIISQAEELAKERAEFTANVSHELKTPLQAIMGSAELLEHDFVKKEDVPIFLGRIRSESERLLTLINNIISLSRLDEKGDFSFEKLDLYDLAYEEVQVLKPIAEKCNVNLVVQGNHLEILGVRQLFHDIIYSLCENAIKYNVKNGSVSVRVYQKDERAHIEVQDTGIGIPQEHQAHVFERFYRVDKSRSKETGGTGLGLSIVKHAVEYMHGTIDLESSEGKGTKIVVSLAM
ncbi:MAG: ATP-binding protein [Phascolarctobacterium sp.]|nr:ATP-binding protein [Phascolarctobacterium sp.]